jgi:methyltransferase (TIGR00027 family)
MPRTAPDRHRPSATAELIAMSVVYLSWDARLGSVLPAGAAAVSERFLRVTSPRRLLLVRQLSRPGARAVLRTLERAVLPGITLHYAVRKRFIEDAVGEFVAAGGRQLVVLGAGLDTLAYRLALAHPGLIAVEFDDPAGHHRKQRAVAGVPASNLHLAAGDLAGTPVGELLSAVPGFRPHRPTFFVLEGVTMYLSGAGVAALLRSAAMAGGPGSRIAWTFLQPDRVGRLGFARSRRGLVNAWLASRGERFGWGIAANRLAGFLPPLGLRLVRIVGADELRARYLAPAGIDHPLATGEQICLCEVPQ